MGRQSKHRIGHESCGPPGEVWANRRSFGDAAANGQISRPRLRDVPGPLPAQVRRDLRPVGMPDRRVAAIAAPLAGFNFNALPFLPTQAVFFTTFFIMLLYARASRLGGKRRDAAIYFLCALVVLVSQAIFAAGGERYVRHWDVTEFQEFFVALGLAALAWCAVQKQVARGRETNKST